MSDKPKLTASTSLLKMLKAGMRLQIAGFADAPVIRRSSMYKEIVVEIPYKTWRYPMTMQGLTDALNIAANGWVCGHFDVDCKRTKS